MSRTATVAAVVLAMTLLAVGVAAPASAQTAADIETRDQLIADQENLLNTYRCRFNVDLSAVANGCANRRTVRPGATPPNPTPQDIDARDGLIQNQENLLNIYRCRFRIDTHIVPGGCVDGKPSEPQQGPDSGSGEHPESISGWVLDSGENDVGGWWSYDRYVDPATPDLSPGIGVVCYGDSTSFLIVVWSDTPVSRSADDESVAVSIDLGGVSGEARWWAEDDDEYMQLFPSPWFVYELLAAGSVTLSLGITDDAGPRQSLAFEMAGFAEVVDYLSQHCPVPLGWENFETENEDGAIWGYERFGTREGTAGSEQWLYARCYADNTTFSLYVSSDTPVKRSSDDESVAVTHRLGGSTGEARWWAADDDEWMAIYPPNWLVSELAAAGPVTLSLGITDDAGRRQSLAFDMTGFADAVDHMAQHCPVPGTGSSGGAITVPSSEPSGRCAAAVAAGVYQWEQCAWAQYWEDRIFNRPLSEAEAQALIARIWAEINVAGKPERPPTSELIPAGSECATSGPDGGFIIGCYQPNRHHIRRLDAFLETLLHEVAHALLANHSSILPCRGITGNDDYQACVHNDIFRCTADHLYTRYAGIPTAGVCGTAPAWQPTNSPATGWRSYRHETGDIATVEAYWHTRPSPYGDSTVNLFVRCGQPGGEIDIHFYFDEGRIEAGANGRISSVLHLFLPEGYSEWGTERQSEYVAANRVDADWLPVRDRRGAFLPERLHLDFVDDATDYAEVLIKVWNPDGSEFGLMAFSLEGAYTHIRPVTEQCGWTWS